MKESFTLPFLPSDEKEKIGAVTPIFPRATLSTLRILRP